MTIFSKIIAGEIPSYKLLEDEHFFAFLDIFPLVKGHTLVVPKVEVDKLYELPDDYLSKMLLFAQPLCVALEKTTDCQRVAMSVIGLEVPHAHLHLIPMNEMADTNFANPKLQLSATEMTAIQQAIIQAL